MGILTQALITIAFFTIILYLFYRSIAKADRESREGSDESFDELPPELEAQLDRFRESEDRLMLDLLSEISKPISWIRRLEARITDDKVSYSLDIDGAPRVSVDDYVVRIYHPQYGLKEFRDKGKSFPAVAIEALNYATLGQARPIAPANQMLQLHKQFLESIAEVQKLVRQLQKSYRSWDCYGECEFKAENRRNNEQVIQYRFKVRVQDVSHFSDQRFSVDISGTVEAKIERHAAYIQAWSEISGRHGTITLSDPEEISNMLSYLGIPSNVRMKLLRDTSLAIANVVKDMREAIELWSANSEN